MNGKKRKRKNQVNAGRSLQRTNFRHAAFQAVTYFVSVFFYFPSISLSFSFPRVYRDKKNSSPSFTSVVTHTRAVNSFPFPLSAKALNLFFFLFTFVTTLFSSSLVSECLPTEFVLNIRFEQDQRFDLRIECTKKHFYRSSTNSL